MSKTLLEIIHERQSKREAKTLVPEERIPNLTTCFNPRKMSLLCRLSLRIDAPLQVCKSAAGYYIGVVGTTALVDKYPQHQLLVGEPLSRDSEEYFPTKEAAAEAFSRGLWTQRLNP